MLQRAASNAYSWWWASHIRTRQSKWLDSNIQEMEDKVKAMIQIIDSDGDSFAKKAELYFRRRPELINFVDDVYRSYKALADKYDRISTELHKANHTIATAFPDEVQLVMQDYDDDDNFPKAITSIDGSKLHKPAAVQEDKITHKKQHHKRISSQMSKEKAQEEIERLQKEILILQTEKEFVKSSYQRGITKYWNIEKQITEMQEDVCSLQDNFSASAVIEDDEARALMVATAIKSCEDSLVSLHKQQHTTTEDAKIESERIKEARKKLNALKTECNAPLNDSDNALDQDTDAAYSKAEEELPVLKEVKVELQSICEKVKEHFQNSSETSVIDMAEKIDGLVDKVISLECTVVSQSAQINRLRSETDELQNHLKDLEEDKQTLINDSDVLIERLQVAEGELQKVQQLEKTFREEKGVFNIHLTEVCNNFYNISEELQSGEPKKQPTEIHNVNSVIQGKIKERAQVQKTTAEAARSVDLEESAKKPENLPSKVKYEERSNKKESVPADDDGFDSSDLTYTTEPEDPDDIPESQSLHTNEEEKKEKKMLLEYKSIIRNFKKTKKKLSDIEKKNREHHRVTKVEVEELKNANTMKDEEIRLLRGILDTLQANANKNVNAQLNTGRSEDHLDNDTDKINAQHIEGSQSLSAEDNIRLRQIIVPEASSFIEEKFRADIDALLEENLDFWLRFSTSYHQIQKFQLTFKEFQAEIEKLNASDSYDPSNTALVLAQDAKKPKPIPDTRRLRELNTELQVWLEQNALLKGELQCRFSSLCSIHDEISNLTSSNEMDDAQFTPCQAAKYQGEVLNMQLENKKVAKELQTGLDHVRSLQIEVGRALSKIHENYQLTVVGKGPQQKNQLRPMPTKNRIPLRTFLFGPKPKKPSLFSCMNPHLQKQYSDLRGFP